MNKYTAALKRLFSPKKYPLYRITPLRYVFLHLLLLSLLLSAPGVTHIYQSISSFTTLIEEKEQDIPDFHIKNSMLELQDNKEKIIKVNGGTVTFTEETTGNSSDIMTFTKNKLYIKNIDPIDYSNLNMIENKKSLVELMKVYTESSFFYFLLIMFILIIFQYTVMLMKVTGISLAAHWISFLAKRKSRFMNWIKITAFLITIPTLIQYIDLLVPNALFNPLSWCIMILLVSIAGWYLPRKKTGK
ncbi:DUF1189 family protein [Macrococcus lamae]|uniref:DUF1189 domain-containing protein n=1 Tax=Macrococcus lamae TaxID=198484 RepID=A0A4R6BXY6_9STAP|nr:DUF1189 family protein [Macrococcus lamae]TDM13128.1 DUF1189 domain-containing protein [Macrococcus lamae]